MPPTSRNPLNALQAAIVTRLKGDAQLAALLATSTAPGTPRQAVYDQPTEGAPYPYVRVGEHVSVPDNDLTSYGRNVTATLHVWTRARGNKAGQDIADRVTALLDHQAAALTVAGHRVVSIRSEFDQALTDPDPEIRHHVLRFRVITAQQS